MKKVNISLMFVFILCFAHSSYSANPKTPNFFYNNIDQHAYCVGCTEEDDDDPIECDGPSAGGQQHNSGRGALYLWTASSESGSCGGCVEYIMDSTPSGGRQKQARMAPVSASPQSLLLRAKMPPIKATIPRPIGAAPSAAHIPPNPATAPIAPPITAMTAPATIPTQPAIMVIIPAAFTICYLLISNVVIQIIALS